MTPLRLSLLAALLVAVPALTPAALAQVEVATGAELEVAVASATEGDEIVLTQSDEPYLVTDRLANAVALTIRAGDDLDARPVIRPANEIGDPLIRPRADLTLEGLDLDAAELSEEVIRIKDARPVPINLTVEDCVLRNSLDGEFLVRFNDEVDGAPVVLGNLIFDEVVFENSARGPIRHEAASDTLWFKDVTAYRMESFRLDGSVGVFRLEDATIFQLDASGNPAVDIRSEDYAKIEIEDAIIDAAGEGA
ncbi:MAG: hypothetical protein AAF809_09420, partial [Bacteroidota bacterium]